MSMHLQQLILNSSLINQYVKRRAHAKEISNTLSLILISIYLVKDGILHVQKLLHIHNSQEQSNAKTL